MILSGNFLVPISRMLISKQYTERFPRTQTPKSIGVRYTPIFNNYATIPLLICLNMYTNLNATSFLTVVRLFPIGVWGAWGGSSGRRGQHLHRLQATTRGGGGRCVRAPSSRQIYLYQYSISFNLSKIFYSFLKLWTTKRVMEGWIVIFKPLRPIFDMYFI